MSEGELKDRIERKKTQMREVSKSYDVVDAYLIKLWIDEAKIEFPRVIPIDATSGTLQMNVVDWNKFIEAYNAWSKKWFGETSDYETMIRERIAKRGISLSEKVKLP